MDQQQIETVETHLQKNVQSCPTCGSTSFDIDDKINLMPTYNKEQNKPNLDEATALVTVTCKNCYRIMVFNAIKLGVV